VAVGMDTMFDSGPVRWRPAERGEAGRGAAALSGLGTLAVGAQQVVATAPKRCPDYSSESIYAGIWYLENH
jgi:hypothetical protein